MPTLPWSRGERRDGDFLFQLFKPKRRCRQNALQNASQRGDLSIKLPRPGRGVYLPAMLIRALCLTLISRLGANRGAFAHVLVAAARHAKLAVAPRAGVAGDAAPPPRLRARHHSGFAPRILPKEQRDLDDTMIRELPYGDVPEFTEDTRLSSNWLPCQRSLRAMPGNGHRFCLPVVTRSTQGGHQTSPRIAS